MKSIINSLFVCLFVAAVMNLHCKKEYSCENCNSNKNPVANAGPDQIIYFPADSVLLDGSASEDPDGTISSWDWTKVSGPASFNMVSPSAAQTRVKNLDTGVYRFSLKVTDNKGLIDLDTVEIKVMPPTTQHNRPPVANAGADQTIILPTNSVTVSGFASTDPDNNITDYLWTKISGPSSFTIVNPGIVQTTINTLVQGIYQFELKVTDAGGLFSLDTLIITVDQVSSSCGSNRPVIYPQLIYAGQLSQTRLNYASVAAGNKLFFAGGSFSSKVDIYDINTNVWTVASLSAPRDYIAAIASGNKVFFAGGLSANGGSSVVDIYDINSGNWSVTQLSEPRSAITCAAVGNKVIFAGGINQNNSGSAKVDIFDLTTQSWSVASLSEARSGMSAVTVQDKVYFAGGTSESPNTLGVTNRIDVFNNTTSSWSTSSLQTSRMNLSATSYGNKIYWAGGIIWTGLGIFTCVVEVFDVNTGQTSIQLLSEEQHMPNNGGQAIINNNNKIAFGIPDWSPSTFDIYNINTNNWSVANLPASFLGHCHLIKAGNNTYITSREGTVNGEVIKLYQMNY